jgi:Leucine-rich repeat (LRR) protein
MTKWTILLLTIMISCSPKTPVSKSNKTDDTELGQDRNSTTMLDLMDKGLDAVPESIFDYPNLKVLWLRNNDITEIPPNFSTLAHLEELSLGSNPIKDMRKTFEILSKLPNLKELDLENTQLKSVPDNIKQLKTLSVLYLWGNPIDSTEITRVKQMLPGVEVQ